MPDELERILGWVAEGRISADEAAPLIEALQRAQAAERRGVRGGAEGAAPGGAPGTPARGRRVRLRVREHGRQVVDLRIPIGFADAAIGWVPGVDDSQATQIRDAIRSGTIGPILEVEDEDGDGVTISVE